jgi:hypothetical protein
MAKLSHVAMLEREETKRVLMGQQPAEQLEVRAIFVAVTTTKPPQNQNSRFNSLELPKCKHSNKDDHTQEACWHLHPELRPKWPRYGEDRGGGGRDSRNRGGNHNEKKKGLLTETNRLGSDQMTQLKAQKAAAPCSSDQMQQLMH